MEKMSVVSLCIVTWVVSIFSVIWIWALYELYKSSNVDKTKEERKSLLKKWKKFNVVLISLLLTLFLFYIFGLVRYSDRFHFHKAPWFFVAIAAGILVPALIRLAFQYIIYKYQKGFSDDSQEPLLRRMFSRGQVHHDHERKPLVPRLIAAFDMLVIITLWVVLFVLIIPFFSKPLLT